MKKVYKLEDLDCAGCAKKMEDAIAKIDGVESVSVSFISQKMTVIADDAEFDKIMKKAAAVCRKIEPDCTIIM